MEQETGRGSLVANVVAVLAVLGAIGALYGPLLL
jgi:hypothetical protein